MGSVSATRCCPDSPNRQFPVCQKRSRANHEVEWCWDGGCGWVGGTEGWQEGGWAGRGGWAGGRGVRCFQYNIGGLPQNPVRTLATDLPRDAERHTARLTHPARQQGAPYHVCLVSITKGDLKTNVSVYQPRRADYPSLHGRLARGRLGLRTISNAAASPIC